MGPFGGQPAGLGADGIPGLHSHVYTMVALRTPVGCRSVLFFPSFPIALLPAFVHIPAFDTRKRAYAGRDNTDGGGIQRTQCADAGRMDILRQPRRQISGIVVLHSAIHSRGVDVRIGNGCEHTFRFGDTRT